MVVKNAEVCADYRRARIAKELWLPLVDTVEVLQLGFRDLHIHLGSWKSSVVYSRDSRLVIHAVFKVC